MKKVKYLDIRVGECQRSTTVWVDDDASDDEIRQAILDDAMSMIEVDFQEVM